MRILLGLSGGFDSAYAALKLKKQGHEVSGAILIMHEYTDVAGAESCAEKLGIPLYTIDCSEVFNSVVKTNFVDEYKNARTPNPCILCNERVKFRCLYDFAIENGFDAIATGHYANVQEIENGEEMRYTVSAAADQSKDQTYMLYRLPQDILSKLVLPMGDEMKSELRANAPEELVSVSEKAESQEICFIPDGDYASYIEALTGVFPKGNFVDDEGRLLGTHNGIIRYTVGQRKGLGVSASSRLFVTDIDPVKNEIKLSDSSFN